MTDHGGADGVLSQGRVQGQWLEEELKDPRVKAELKPQADPFLNHRRRSLGQGRKTGWLRQRRREREAGRYHP